MSMILDPNKQYDVRLSGAEIDLVYNALGKLPYEVVAGFIHSLPPKISEVKPVAQSETPKE